MTVPYREWLLPSVYRTLHALDPDSHNYNQSSDWGTTPIPYSKWGEGRPTANSYELWRAIFRPDDPTFTFMDGMDAVVDFGIEVIVAKDTFGTDKDYTFLTFQCLWSTPVWDDNLVSGRYYDGVNNWSLYPQKTAFPYSSNYQLNFSGFTSDTVSRYAASFAAGQAQGYLHADNFFDNGIVVTHDYTFYKAAAPTALLIGEEYSAQIICNRLEARFFNPVVNSISERRLHSDGGQSLILTGLGFDNDDAELSDTSRSHYTVIPGGGWHDEIDYIDIINVQTGATIETLRRTFGEFSIDSNSQITIPIMPALAEGFYWLYLRKVNVEGGIGDVFAYAGDWRADANGRVQPGDRLSFLVHDEKIPPEPPLPFFEWEWKWGDLTIKEHYAPIDTRATETFWDGRILGLSSLTRSIDDKTGLFNVSDVNVELANQDKHFSKLLANYFCKGQLVQLACGRGLEPEAWHESIFFAMVDDYSLAGPSFKAKLKDFAQKYMKGQQPRHIITRNEYPDCKDAAVGQAIPELVGRHYFTAGSAPGAIQAHCTDATSFIYVCARGPLHAFLNVYSDGVAVNPADYATFTDPAGRQFIQLDNDQEDKKITFNCEGYMFGDWNSPNGYIQNPAYVIAFYWAMLLEIPINFIDMDAVDVMATHFNDAGLGEIGKLHIVSLEEKGAILQKLLFSFGIKYWQTKAGLLTLGRKDIASLATSIFIHAQIEVMDIPDRAYNLESAVNLVKAYYNHFPAADLFEGSIEESDASSIAQFGSEMSPSQPWEYPFITDADFCEQRVLEDLLKFSYGDKYIKFTLPFEMIGEIDIFDNFQLQDPYGLSATGEGEIGRYYYITSLAYDYQNSTIGVVAIDLQWLLQQYFIFGDEDTMPNLWEDASEFFRYYGYLCDEDTEEFADGFRGKILIDENSLEQE